MILLPIYYTPPGKFFFSGPNDSSLSTKIIPQETKEILQNLFQESKNNKIKNNSTLWLTSLSELPNYKLKNYIKENKLNISTARKFSQLDNVIISDSFIEREYFTSNYDEYIIFNSLTIKNLILEKLGVSGSYKGPKNLLDPNFYLVITSEDYDSIIQTNPDFKAVLEDKATKIIKGYALKRRHGSVKAYDKFDFLIDLIDNIKKYNIKVVLDSSLQEDINKGLTIDYDVFETLYGMLKNNDMGSWELAKEIISNNEYESSKPYLIFLYCVFPELRKSSMNNNYTFFRKNLNKIYVEKVFPKQYSKLNFPIEKLIAALVNTYPQYSIEFSKCLVHHLNQLSEKTIIKDITLI
jgi:hypothetical protein